MKLLTKAIEKNIPAYLETDHIQVKDKTVAVKYFTPFSSWTWYVFEGTPLPGGDWEFFGLVVGHEKELGSFLLSDLESLGNNCERDLLPPKNVPEYDLPDWCRT
jgi:hypothetical protein